MFNKYCVTICKNLIKNKDYFNKKSVIGLNNTIEFFEGELDKSLIKETIDSLQNLLDNEPLLSDDETAAISFAIYSMNKEVV